MTCFGRASCETIWSESELPYQMHSDYLRRLFLNNDLAEGRHQVNGRPVALSVMHMPMFVVGTLRDHVAPWKSTYKINLLASADITYVQRSNSSLTCRSGSKGSRAASSRELHDLSACRRYRERGHGAEEWH
jgi:polyhydroxyalkanoate synthase